MRTIKKNEELLFDALAEFKSKETPTSNDVMSLFVTFHNCMTRGMLWTTVNKILDDVGYPVIV